MTRKRMTASALVQELWRILDEVQDADKATIVFDPRDDEGITHFFSVTGVIGIRYTPAGEQVITLTGTLDRQ